MNSREENIQIFISLFKSLYGHTPNANDRAEIKSWDDTKLNYRTEQLSEMLDERDQKLQRTFANNKFLFDECIEGMMIDYQLTRGQALQWEMEHFDAFDIEDLLYMWGVELSNVEEYQKELFSV